MNRIRVLLSWSSILPAEPPTTIARRERAAEEAHEAQQKQLASKILREEIKVQEEKPLLAGSE